MSNRLIQVGRIPLIPDPHVALKASQALSFSQVQTDRVMALGQDYVRPVARLGNAIRRYADRLERALQIRNLATMNDTTLADIGFRRDQLPQLYYGSASYEKAGNIRDVRLSDSKR